MRIVVGLGNPGSRYVGSRHNIGFAVVEMLVHRWGWVLGRTRDGWRAAKGNLFGQPVMVVEPQMYMNLSGEALARLPGSVTASKLIAVHDDIDLDPGCVRVKRGGGTAGHRGLDSIVERYGRDFVRVRIGVGRPPAGVDPADYVLGRFAAAEREGMEAAVQRAADAVEWILKEGEEATMNAFNVRPRGAATTRAGRK